MGLFDFFEDIPVVGDILGGVKDVVGFAKDAGPLLQAGAEFFGSREQMEMSQEMAREQMAFQHDENAIARAFNQEQGQYNRDFQNYSQNLNMAFQERMSNSAYQRATQDMKAAGLNPILAYKQGGSSTPVGAGVTGAQAAGASGASGAMGQAQNVIGSAARAAVQTGMQLDRLDAEIDNMNEDTQKKKTEVRLNDQLQKRVQSEVSLNQQTERNKEVENLILNENLTSARSAATADRMREDMLKTDIGEIIRWIGTAGKELNPFLGSANSARNLVGR